MLRILFITYLLSVSLLHPASSHGADLPELSPAAAAWLGERIFLNECNAREDCLTSWNTGENFPSLGIGHFIWFHRGQISPFEETFPALMHFMQDREPGIMLPGLVTHTDFEAPWSNREQFLNALESPAMAELRHFLATRKELQARFIINRFHESLPALITASLPEQRSLMDKRIESIAAVNPPQGLYALIDYVHFKGTGLAESERYRNQGWGLYQVLVGMEESDDPLSAFVASAAEKLENRVNNAPPERNEARWLQGWLNRLDTYLVAPAVQ